jgi:hypothetical protein
MSGQEDNAVVFLVDFAVPFIDMAVVVHSNAAMHLSNVFSN